MTCLLNKAQVGTANPHSSPALNLTFDLCYKVTESSGLPLARKWIPFKSFIPSLYFSYKYVLL